MSKALAAELYAAAFDELIKAGILLRNTHHQGDTLALNPDALEVDTEVAFISTVGSHRRLAVPRRVAQHLIGMPCLDAVESTYELLIPEADDWWARRFSRGDLRRVIAAEHTGLLERPQREALELRFKDKKPTALVREPAVGHAHAGDGCRHRWTCRRCCCARCRRTRQVSCSAWAARAAVTAMR